MLDFCTYFFGEGTEKEFSYFSLAHFLPIIFMITIIVLTYKFRNRLRTCKGEERIRITLAFIMLVSEMSYFWRMCGVESLVPTPIDHLPITVCGWALIFCSVMVLTKNQTLFDIAYFWVFAGSTFGLITPTVITECGPTRFRFYQFWLEHTMGFITLFYMMFIHGMRPNWKSIIKSYACLVILGIVAIIANNMFPGANYLFMAEKTEAKSITEILPSNYVVRVITMAIIIGILFFIAYLPWLIMDIRKKKKLILAGTENNETNKEQPLEQSTTVATEEVKVEDKPKRTTTKKTNNSKTTSKSSSKKTTTKTNTK